MTVKTEFWCLFQRPEAPVSFVSVMQVLFTVMKTFAGIAPNPAIFFVSVMECPYPSSFYRHLAVTRGGARTHPRWGDALLPRAEVRTEVRSGVREKPEGIGCLSGIL